MYFFIMRFMGDYDWECESINVLSNLNRLGFILQDKLYASFSNEANALFFMTYTLHLSW